MTRSSITGSARMLLSSLTTRWKMLTTWSTKVRGFASARWGALGAGASDISGLLLAKQGQRQGQKDERDERDRGDVLPEVYDAERLGEHADRYLLVPGRRERQADDPRPAGKRGDRREHSGEIDRGYDRKDRGREDGCDLGPGKGRDQHAETNGRNDIDQRSHQQNEERPLRRDAENENRDQQQGEEGDHRDCDIGQLLADQVLESGDRRRAEVCDRARLLLTHDRDRRHDRRNQAQQQHEDAGHHRVHAEKGLVVAKTGLNIVVPPGIGAAWTMKRPLQFLTLRSDYPRHVVLRGFAAKRHGAVDRRVDLRRPAVEKVA